MVSKTIILERILGGNARFMVAVLGEGWIGGPVS